jgi:hypothetical protein
MDRVSCLLKLALMTEVVKRVGWERVSRCSVVEVQDSIEELYLTALEYNLSTIFIS